MIVRQAHHLLGPDRQDLRRGTTIIRNCGEVINDCHAAKSARIRMVKQNAILQVYIARGVNVYEMCRSILHLQISMDTKKQTSLQHPADMIL